MTPVKVLVVDDSVVIRKVIARELSKDPGILVVGTAPDPYVARDLILQLKPDVLTLDVEMPKMDGITFLQKLMKHHPMPVIIVSSLTPAGGELAIAALEAGAFDVIPKPGPGYSMTSMGPTLIAKVKAASGKGSANLRPRPPPSELPPGTTSSTDGVILRKSKSRRVIAIGASTGGTGALIDLIGQLPLNCPPVVIVQHMPETYTGSFAKRLNERGRLVVKEARGSEALEEGIAFLAPGNAHLKIVRSGGIYKTILNHDEPVNRHRPSVDVLFRSLAVSARQSGVGIILTGMGSDGAQGLLEMRRAGAVTIGEAESTCVVYGMPKVAKEMNAVETELPLYEIPRHLISVLNSPNKKKR